MHNTDQKFWFPAKRYGWGWGMPTRWQGWLVIGLFFILLMLGIKWFEPQAHPLGFLAYTLALSIVLSVVCWLKGEPARWRWGK